MLARIPAAVESRLQLIEEAFAAHHDRLRSLVDEVVAAHDLTATREVPANLAGLGPLPHHWSSLDLVASVPGLEWLAGAAETGSRTRVLCDTRTLRRTGVFALLRMLLDRGVAVRVSHSVLPALAVPDRTRVLLWSANGSAPPAVIDQPDVAVALAGVYATLWRSATELHRPMWADSLTPAQQRVLQLLRSGLSDDEISRAVGTSTQAVRLHIGSIMSRLQASTRFSAGVAAARLERGEPYADAFGSGQTRRRPARTRPAPGRGQTAARSAT